jgi:hypothetical protein
LAVDYPVESIPLAVNWVNPCRFPEIGFPEVVSNTAPRKKTVDVQWGFLNLEESPVTE